ncbi:transmembrane protein, putative (macronuclear) [Tetrahymena thermophila SB210]|uniref:Transmembrane protein, putative n=1 Tax=Tetrahymena thermophila (strain SB210) TaxID=312017 RepID=Q23QJ2_TETTS|nr:transmembrane protein, putative [Tetrahymena thermophila SB210]EAR98896.2 transmembrane protein, putative [Tetrahymena thermophila SB210]|eukprot:XP_001019141.2 transmembrane protein, putative [Tetrahymena thermophila SB210]
MMKQKEIIATELISKIESMQKLIKQLKTNLNYLIQLNDDSLDLLNLQALFLENLSFSEKDINLVQVNKYRRKQTKYFNPLKEDEMLSSIINSDKFDEKTCIIFVSYKDSKKMQINHVSSNFFNLFSFTNRENIQGRSIESIIPLAFQTAHRNYIKEYLLEEVTSNMYSNDTEQPQDRGIIQNQNSQLQQKLFDQQQDFQFDQSEQLSKNQAIEEILMYQSRGSKMNKQIIFASLNQMFVLPVRVDIRTNEFKENKTFGLVAKVKQINEECQYVLFNETDLSVIGLTEQLHETFFPTCENLQKINLREIFPFLISPKNRVKPLEDIEAIDMKKKLHINLSNDMEDFLKDQVKNQFKKKNKLAFIVIQNQDMTSITLASSLKSSKNKYSAKNLNKIKSTKEISSYCFTYLELIIKKLNYSGINNISYIEIVKIRQINPILQAPFIYQEITNTKKQNIYSQFFSFPEEFQNLISNLEQQTINYYPINSIDSQFNFTSRYQNQTKNGDEQNNILLSQQQLQKSQDDSINLKQIKLQINKLENEDTTCQEDFEFCNQQFNQLIEQNNDKNQKQFGKLQCNFNLPQQHSIQNINRQDSQFIQSLQEIQQIDYEEGENHLNRTNLAFKDNSVHRIQDDQQHFNNNYALLSPCKSDKTLNIELVSPVNSSCINIFPNQQSLTNLSHQDLKSHQTKETSQQDLECIKNQYTQIFNKTNTYLKKIKEKTKSYRSRNANKNTSPCRLANALDKQHQRQLNNQFNFDKQNNVNLIDKNKKKKQIQNIQYDIASTNSKDSSSASAKRQLYQIMADKSILQVIKVIKMIGIACFAVMACMTWVQFISMEQDLREANEDFQVFNWPTTYSSSLSDILKYKNTQYLIQFSTQLDFPSMEQRLNFYNRVQSEMDLTLTEVYELLSEMLKANTKRKVFQQIRETKSFYIFGQLYNTTLLSSVPSDSVELISFNHDTSLLSSILLGLQLTFRYVNNLGNRRPEYYLIQNQLSAISQLQQVQNNILIQQQNDQQYIEEQLSILVIILVVVSAACVAIIIPLYFYIQKERDSIIYLLTTFPTIKMDSLIKNIQNSYFSQSIQSQYYQNQNDHQLLDSIVSLQVLNNDKNIRTQNISSITRLPRYNKSLILASLCVYILMICYPIIVKVLTQDYLNKTTIDLKTMMKVYYLRSYLLQNMAMHFNILTMKVNPRLKPMKPDIYYEYLQTLIKQQEDIYNDIQWVSKSQYKDKRFNQEEYDDFFFSTFKGNLCDSFRNHPQYNTNSTRINVEMCNQSQQGFLSQGLQIAFKNLFNSFSDLYNLYMIQDQSEQQSQISNFLSKFDIQGFTDFTEFIDETIISLNQFILLQGNNYYQQIKIWLIALIGFQIVLMVLIFSFGWNSFTNYLNGQLHKTKNYLQILDVNTLIENPYILTYIKKNTVV